MENNESFAVLENAGEEPHKADFRGRIQERKTIHNFFSDETMHTALMYGRRRVGKSELLRRCIDETENIGIYYECKQTSESNNVESLAEIISEKLGFPKLAFSSLEEIFEFLYKQTADRKIIFVLDEYPYLHSVTMGLDSVLQSLIDKYSKKSALKLVLCGSYVDSMKSLLAEHNPLYGRIDLTINLKPMDYYESALFYPTFSDEDKVRLYSVFGGIPYYNNLISPKKSVRQNIIDLISGRNSRFENEVSMYLKSEISKIVNANEIFEALAKGYSKFSDILSQSHVSSSPTLSDVLEKLMRMDVVKKVSPINDEHNRKKSGYLISDGLSLFYYKYVFRYGSQRAVMNDDAFFDKYVAEDLEQNYVPKIFEEIARQFLIRKNQAGELEIPFEKIGKYYYNNRAEKTNGEFDVVTLDDKGYVFYEAKFKKGKILQKDIVAEIEQVRDTGMNCYKYGFFSRSGFGKISDELKKDVTLYSIKDLYR